MAKATAAMLDYDESADVLYVTLGPARPAYSVEPEEGVLLRVDPDSGALVGLTILHFQRRLKEPGDRLAAIPLVPADLLPVVIRKWRQTNVDKPKTAA